MAKTTDLCEMHSAFDKEENEFASHNFTVLPKIGGNLRTL